MERVYKILIGIAILLSMLAGNSLAAAPHSDFRIGFGDYDPLGLVIRRFGWLEETLAQEGIRVHWIYCPTGRFALQHIDAHELDMGTCVGLTSMFNRSHGGHNKAICVTSRLQWISLLVDRDSQISSVRELKGRSIAVNPNSESYFSLRQVLHESGMTMNDVTIVPAHHELGIATLILKRVDAWIGLNPWAAQARLDHGAREIYRTRPFSTIVLLNTSDEFANSHPDIVEKVVQAYEKARRFALTHYDEVVDIYATDARVSYQVSQQALNQNDFSNSQITRSDILELKMKGKMIHDECVIHNHIFDVNKTVNQMIDDRFIRKSR